MIKTGKFLAVICFFVFIAMLTVQTSYASRACTPGYWKNHTDEWVYFKPNWKVGDVFEIPAAYPDIANATLLEALSFKGGPEVEGAIRILLRTAVAAALNQVHPDTYDSYVCDPVPEVTSDFIATLDRCTILALAELWDKANNGFCPLD